MEVVYFTSKRRLLEKKNLHNCIVNKETVQSRRAWLLHMQSLTWLGPMSELLNQTDLAPASAPPLFPPGQGS